MSPTRRPEDRCLACCSLIQWTGVLHLGVHVRATLQDQLICGLIGLEKDEREAELPSVDYSPVAHNSWSKGRSQDSVQVCHDHNPCLPGSTLAGSSTQTLTPEIPAVGAGHLNLWAKYPIPSRF